ncbi:MAG TPA: hypothetical protein VFP60_06045 [Pseudolabrys sp.]|nr:hypothetical protein [Pseudolabrys sp.]
MRSKRATGDPVKPGAGGLRGPDRQQEGLRDRRGGAADNIVPQSEKPMREHRTPHEDAQPGSAIQPETEAPDEGTPERLRRMEDPDRIIKQAVKDAQHTLTEYMHSHGEGCEDAVEKLLTTLDNNDVAEAILVSDELEQRARRRTRRAPGTVRKPH